MININKSNINDYTKEELWEALINLIGLQSHYASLLNMYDGGKRIEFLTIKQYMDRCKEIKNK